MGDYITPLQRLIEQFRKLPGIGGKTAARLAFAVLSYSEEEAAEFARAITDAKVSIHTCRVCCNISEHTLCGICADERRDHGLICVVEDPRDIMAIERVRDYRGTYHVLGGHLSPTNGIGPDALHMKELFARIADEQVEEVIIATNPSVEGEATAVYLAKLLKPFGVRVSRLAYGIPVGGALEFADELTLRRAIEGRNDM
ncbi:MAG: recombination mediator RecR [Eubacteriales bacterium]